MLITDFDYELPEELIAQAPLTHRDASRMLVLDRAQRNFYDAEFQSLPDYLNPNDVLVLNNTKVLPARLVGERPGSGGNVELLLLREHEAGIWEALIRPGRRLRPGARIAFTSSQVTAEVLANARGGNRLIRFEPADNIRDLLRTLGQTPLPPYIKREDGETTQDRERYQTVYASRDGAIAAPTAGLHFTESVLKNIAKRGVSAVEITLHVGYGTFVPVRVNDISKHSVLPENTIITSESARVVNEAGSAGGRVLAVGTTTVRALESAANENGEVTAGSQLAALTIVPGYNFNVVDALLTNFHLPRSSLLLLVSAFAGKELILEAYQHAVNERYRFYSYGDCMLII